jgi:hypothetical protein
MKNTLIWGIFEVIFGDLVVSFIMHTFGEELGKRISPSPKWAGFTYPHSWGKSIRLFSTVCGRKGRQPKRKGTISDFWGKPLG